MAQYKLRYSCRNITGRHDILLIPTELAIPEYSLSGPQDICSLHSQDTEDDEITYIHVTDKTKQRCLIQARRDATF